MAARRALGMLSLIFALLALAEVDDKCASRWVNFDLWPYLAVLAYRRRVGFRPAVFVALKTERLVPRPATHPHCRRTREGPLGQSRLSAPYPRPPYWRISCPSDSAFLEVIGFWDPQKRFWTESEFSTAPEVCGGVWMSDATALHERERLEAICPGLYATRQQRPVSSLSLRNTREREYRRGQALEFSLRDEARFGIGGCEPPQPSLIARRPAGP
jgi:hypothetical protein